MQNDLLITKVAMAYLLGATPKEIGQDIGVPPQKISKIINSPECQDRLKELSEKALNEAKTKIKEQTAVLVPEIIATLRSHLKERNLQALPHALKILGIGDEEGNKQATSISVIMPMADGNTIDITPDKEQE